MQITVTSDFFNKGGLTAPLTGVLLNVFRDTSGAEWFAFELPDVYGVWVIPADSRFLLSVGGKE